MICPFEKVAIFHKNSAILSAFPCEMGLLQIIFATIPIFFALSIRKFLRYFSKYTLRISSLGFPLEGRASISQNSTVRCFGLRDE
jgi:hypothetical protein